MHPCSFSVNLARPQRWTRPILSFYLLTAVWKRAGEAALSSKVNEKVIISYPDREDARTALAGGYLQGACSAFAIAVSRRTGWPLVALWDATGLVHSGCRTPEGAIAHAAGIVSEDEFRRSAWGELRDCDEATMLGSHPQTEEQIVQAGIHADLMLDLPGRSPTSDRYRAFAEDLVALCERHGIYLRGAMPSGSGIVAYDAYGDEAGLEVGFMATGQATISRRL